MSALRYNCGSLAISTVSLKKQLKAVVSLLSGPCVLWESKFGSWVLHQPGRNNAYAQGV